MDQGFLTRLAAAVVRHARLIVVLAALGVVVAGGFGAGAVSRLSQGGFDSSSEPAERAATVLDQQFHTAAPNLVIDVTATDGDINSAASRAAGVTLTQRLARIPDVSNVASYWSTGRPNELRSSDGRHALVVARINGDQNAVVRNEPAVVRDIGSPPAGLRMQVGGFADAFHEVNARIQRDLVRVELLTVPITAVLLLLIFGSVVAAMLPLMVAGIAVTGSLLAFRILTTFTAVSVFTINMTTVLGLGLAIDYGLFIVSRYREELAAGLDPHAAVVRTVGTAGRTVAGSALTVAAALAALLVFPLMFLRSFAYAGIAVAALAGFAALVVLPAVLALIGTRIDAFPVRRRAITSSDEGIWRRTALTVMRRPWPFLLAGVAVLCFLGSPVIHLRLGYADYRVLPPSNAERVVNDDISQTFGSGVTNVITVVAPTASVAGSVGRASLTSYAERLSQLRGVGEVDTSTGAYVHGQQRPTPTAYLAQFRGGSGAWLSVVPSIPPLAEAGKQLVRDVRAVPAPFPVLVGGLPAQLLDSTAIIYHRLPIALGLILLVMLAVLLVLFRSIVLPLKALVLNILSLAATFGAMVWIFQEGHFARTLDFTATGNLIATMPVLMFCVAFGLSMDYEVFLVTRIREEHERGVPTRDAIAIGLQRSGRIVTAAALLMSVVFIGLVASGISFIKMFGLGLSLAVLSDAFIVRSLIVPAFMSLAGEANWWLPSRRGRAGTGQAPRSPALLQQSGP
jgi:putative drug exporter of the RND superfamily